MEMTRNAKIILGGLVLAVVLVMVAIWTTTSQAKATEWTGCYVGAGLGYSSTVTDAELGLGPAALTIDGLGADGAQYGVLAGCDVRMDRIVVGLMGDYTWHEDSEFDIGISAPGFSSSIASMSIEDEWTIAARAGFLITPDVLAYGLVGYTEASTSDLDIDIASVSFDGTDPSGIVWGAGMEASLGNGWFVRGEYRYSDFDEETVDLIPGFVDLDLDSDVQSGRVAVTYKFSTASPFTAQSEPLK